MKRIIVPDVATIDYETEAIERRPEYPPKPVGVAIWLPRAKPIYMAWGHPCENNCSFAQAKSAIKDVRRRWPVLYHNSKFDAEVELEHFGIPLPHPTKYHDTLFLAFLDNPRSLSFHLKDLGVEYLVMEPTERDELKEWILANVDGATERNAGAFICKGPGKLVGKYAIGDVVRTYKLFKLLYPIAMEFGMGEAYERELRLMPAVLSMERDGVPVLAKRLKKDLGHAAVGRAKPTGWYKSLDTVERRIYKKLGGPFDISSPRQLGERLEHYEFLNPDNIIKTAKSGQISTKIEALETMMIDEKLLLSLKQRSALTKYIGTYGEPWLERAAAHNGVIYPRINQVRGEDGGAYTGRLSMYDPSLHNVPRNPSDDADFAGARELLPFLRNYLWPGGGQVMNARDYSQQELRVLAHFEQGALYQRYLKDPRIDAHDAVRELIAEIMHIMYERSDVKMTNFGIIYGMGIGTLARKTKKSLAEARQLKRAVLKALPGARELMDTVSRMARRNEPIRTWGGRVYYCEEPKMVDGKVKTFEYKLLNTLIQGSAADCTKQAMINYYEAADPNRSRLVLQVHDELVAVAAVKHARKEMDLLRDAMESVPFSVKMLSDGKVSAKSWGEMKKVNY